MFISRYFFEYSKLSIEEKCILILGQESDDDLFNSVDTVENPKLWDIIKIANRKWKFTPYNIQCAWEERTALLKNRPIPGKYKALPPEVLDPSVNLNMITGLYLDWKQFSQTRAPCIVRKPCSGILLKSDKIGHKQVILRTQKYKKTYVNYNVQLGLFGCRFNKLNPTEVIQRHKQSTVLHFFSLLRLREVFTLSGLCSIDHNRGNRVHTCCAKVSAHHKVTGKLTTSFIIDETKSHLCLHMSNNTSISLPRGSYCSITGEYDFTESSDRYSRTISEVWPVCFVIYNSSHIQMTVACYCYDKDNNLICENNCN